ncbi:MAG: hypothetical protein QXP34_00560 [Candidatus Aenigmatarchaeota archaeon]
MYEMVKTLVKYLEDGLFGRKAIYSNTINEKEVSLEDLLTRLYSRRRFLATAIVGSVIVVASLITSGVIPTPINYVRLDRYRGEFLGKIEGVNRRENQYTTYDLQFESEILYLPTNPLERILPQPGPKFKSVISPLSENGYLILDNLLSFSRENDLELWLYAKDFVVTNGVELYDAAKVSYIMITQKISAKELYETYLSNPNRLEMIIKEFDLTTGEIKGINSITGKGVSIYLDSRYIEDIKKMMNYRDELSKYGKIYAFIIYPDNQMKRKPLYGLVVIPHGIPEVFPIIKESKYVYLDDTYEYTYTYTTRRSSSGSR